MNLEKLGWNNYFEENLDKKDLKVI